jgi:hypothetical protein
VSAPTDPRLRKVIVEAREDFGTGLPKAIDWSEIDEKLFARLEQERRLQTTRAMGPRGGRNAGVAWGLGAAAVAAAACFALLAGGPGNTHGPSLEAPVTLAPASAAGTVVGILGSGELLVDGKPAALGATLHLGNVIETRGTSVTVDRPGKLTMVLEAGTRAQVTHVQGALIVAIDTGAVEAQVVPVATGEAFAVDVAGSRVAVHGTHLRVERVGDHVAVDLNEGVVVLGAAPREGSTVGTLVTAPAHADFDATTLSDSLVVAHDPFVVRAPVAVGAPTAALQPPSAALLLPPAAHSAEPRAPSVPAQPVARPAAIVAATAAAEPAPDANAPATLGAAVRACMAARQSPENVTVEVSTTLHVELDDSGHARAARFDPPVAPDVNACAAPVIYRTRWTHGGSGDVPVDFKLVPPGGAQ